MENVSYETQLEALIAARRDFLDRATLPKLKENVRLFQTAFQGIYKVLFKKGLIHEDPYKYELKISDLIPDKDQPRKHIDEATLVELKNSIEKHGVLQPILFRKDDKGKLIIVSGERRYQASKLAGKETIPAIFITDDAREIALVENLLRLDLNPIEEAEALESLKAEKKYTLNQLSAVIGKAPSTISEILSLNNLPTRIKNKCR